MHDTVRRRRASSRGSNASLDGTGPYATARQCLSRLGSILRQRAEGSLSTPDAPDWIDPELVESISLRLPGRHASIEDWALHVALRDGYGAAALPRAIALGGAHPGLPLRMRRDARARLQALAPRVERVPSPCVLGTATCLVNDRLNPRRHYVLTAGHVAAPNADARVDEAVSIGGAGTGYLSSWQPALGPGTLCSAVDGALLEVDDGVAQALRGPADNGALLPTGVSDAMRLNTPVKLRRSHAGDLAGELRIYWSGQVELDANPGSGDYVLTDAIGYACTEATRAGDSGAALWTAAEDRLAGMHLAGLPDGGAAGSNAVMGRIQPVLNWFAVVPFVRGGGAPTGPLPSPVVTPRVAADPVQAVAGYSREAEVVAKTLWGEARGEPEEGMRAVASVIQNRMRRAKRAATEICLAKYQFSCWLAGDPNRPKLDTIHLRPDVKYQLARTIAAELLGGTLRDASNGATHYYATSLPRPPYWARGKTPCKVIGGHRFFNNID